MVQVLSSVHGYVDGEDSDLGGAVVKKTHGTMLAAQQPDGRKLADGVQHRRHGNRSAERRARCSPSEAKAYSVNIQKNVRVSQCKLKYCFTINCTCHLAMKLH